MSKELKQELAALLEEKERRIRYNKINTLFPDEGEFRRELYPKHIEFMNAGAQYSQRAFIAANRTGKTLTGAYEMACHLTGRYPGWWQGKRFKTAIQAWASSIRNEDTKNILQFELLGDILDVGSGMIPKDCIHKYTRKAGVTDAVDTVYVKHVSGGMSILGFKAYEQGREAFQGTKKQVIWLDEEPKDRNIFSECLTRTSGGTGKREDDGIMILTFTPLFGLSALILEFLDGGRFPVNGVNPDKPYRFVCNVDWEDVPHLSEEYKAEALASYSEHERAARSQGIPSLGSGAIYPYPETQVVIRSFVIPAWYEKWYGLDVGWKTTAAVFIARDPDTGIHYVYSEHYVGQEHPSVHASAIRQRGDWLLGAVDPKADSRSQIDGTKLMQVYLDEGLQLIHANAAVESGIASIRQMLAAGQLKIFNTCTNLLSEYRIYRRDEDGRIVKKNDHALDAMRYALNTPEAAQAEPDLNVTPAYAAPVKNINPITGHYV